MRQLGILLGGLLFLYFALYGVAIYYVLGRTATNDEQIKVRDRVEWAYYPVSWLCERCPPFRVCISPYYRFCKNRIPLKDRAYEF